MTWDLLMVTNAFILLQQFDCQSSLFSCVKNAERGWFTLNQLKTTLKDGDLLGNEPLELVSMLQSKGEQVLINVLSAYDCMC
jgi:hypothetical protein